jgi:hypothetical protein
MDPLGAIFNYFTEPVVETNEETGEDSAELLQNDFVYSNNTNNNSINPDGAKNI